IGQLFTGMNGNRDKRFLIWATQELTSSASGMTCSFDGTLIVLETNQRSNDQYLTTRYSILNTLY
ncbi:MAG TPA: hypothetical protein PLI03_00750, partial [Chitinophagales bacterium]|nr:hypothetical protein [Chitinophagales bacterium]